MPAWLHLGVKFSPRRLQDAFKTPQDAPAWCPRRPKYRPRGAQDASRTAKELPKKRPGTGQDAPWSQGMPKSRPDSLQTSILDHFGDDSEPCLVGS